MLRQKRDLYFHKLTMLPTSGGGTSIFTSLPRYLNSSSRAKLVSLQAYNVIFSAKEVIVSYKHAELPQAYVTRETIVYLLAYPKSYARWRDRYLYMLTTLPQAHVTSETDQYLYKLITLPQAYLKLTKFFVTA